MIYYINMKKDKKRNKWMQKQLKNYSHKRIEAIDGKNKKQLSNIFITLPKMNESQGELGCLASHLKAIKTAYQNNLDEVLILEDDLDLELFHKYKDNLFKKWNENREKINLIQIFTNSHSCKVYKDFLSKKELNIYPVVDEFKNMWGAQGYIINKEGINKIMEYYDIEKDIFDLDEFDSYLKSDVFLYSVCNTNIINFPFLNLTKFPSTIHKKHDAIIRDPVMNFINANKKEMMEIMDKIE